MKTRAMASGLVLLLCAWGLQPVHNAAASPRPAPAVQVDCQGVFRELTQDPDWLDQAIDPVLTDGTQVAQRLALYTQVHDCIPADATDQTLQSIRALTEYFMIFTGGYQTPADGSTFSMLDLATYDDPAVNSLRDTVGIAPPPGLVYVRLYPSRQVMPDLVKAAFNDPDVKGVTIYARYVAVLAEHSAGQPDTLPKTLSHELVHAYLKSLQGVKNMAAFPTWYDEGMAIHFSGSSDPSCVTTSTGEETVTTCQTSPAEYVQYAANFEYLEAKVGQEQFLQVVKYSFENLDPTVIYQAAGDGNYESFAGRARSWKTWHDFLPKAEIGGACILPFVIFLIVYLWRQIREGAEPANCLQIHSSPPYQGS